MGVSPGEGPPNGEQPPHYGNEGYPGGNQPPPGGDQPPPGEYQPPPGGDQPPPEDLHGKNGTKRRRRSTEQMDSFEIPPTSELIIGRIALLPRVTMSIESFAVEEPMAHGSSMVFFFFIL